MIRKILVSITLALVLLFSALPLEAAAAGPVPDEALDRFIEEKVKELNIPGLAIAVAHRDEIVYSRVFGSGVQRDTRFYIGSVSKSFTALAIMQLVEKGKIDLDNPVSTYIREFQVSDAITVRHLLHHTSGMTEFGYMPALPHRADFAELVEDMNPMPLSYPPGEEFAYFNQNYSLLGMIVERVSGKPYATYIEDNIFRPLGLENASAQGGVDLPGHLSFFVFSVRRFEPFIQYDLPAGFITSSAEDLVCYLEAIRTQHPAAGVSAEGLKHMQMEDAYGMGWVSGRYAGRPAVHHGGSLPGFYTQAIMLIDDEYSVALLINKGHILNAIFTYTQFSRDIVAILSGQHPAGGLQAHRIMQIFFLFLIATVVLNMIKLIKLLRGSKKISPQRHFFAAAVNFTLPVALIMLIPLGMEAILQRGFTWQLGFLTAPDAMLWFLLGMGFTFAEGALHLYHATRQYTPGNKK